MTRWQYHRVQIESNDVGKYDAYFNKLGSEGWEMVTAVLSFAGLANSKFVHVWFRRALP